VTTVATPNLMPHPLAVIAAHIGPRVAALISAGSVTILALDATTLSAFGSVLSGIAALLAASFAALGGYTRWKNKQTPDVEHDPPAGRTEDETAHYLLQEIARLKAEKDSKPKDGP